MFKQEIFLLIWRVLLFQTLILASVSLFPLYEYGWIYKTCDNNATFKQLIDISISKCVEECIRRQRCEIVMFHTRMNFCALKEAVNTTTLEEKEPLCGYHNPEGYNMNPCTNHTCRGNERCTDKAENEYECIKSECPAPNKIENAAVLSYIHDIGTTNRYKCNPGYIGKGRPTIFCDSNANWTRTNFTCKLGFCPPPKGSYFNADLTSVKGDAFNEGTTLYFTCRNGYRSIGETTISTCTAGEWHPNIVPCCHDNSTHIWGIRCIRFIDPGIAHSLSDASSHCDSLGGRLTWFERRMADLLVDREDVNWILQYSRKSTVIGRWNYTKCLISNGVTDVTPKSFDDKVNEIKSNNWQGDECWWGHIWAPGQPNGGDAENCVIVPRAEYLFHDISCSFEIDNVGFFCRFELPSI